MDNYLLDKYKKILIDKFGVTENSWDKGLQIWINKFGDSDKKRIDFIWSVFNGVIQNIGETFEDEEDLYRRQKEIYVEMFCFLCDEGRNMTHIQKQINFCDLKLGEISAAKSRWKYEVVFIANKCCSECDKLDGIKISIQEALNTKPLPNPKCTRERGCYCHYSVIAARDENGRLIMI